MRERVHLYQQLAQIHSDRRDSAENWRLAGILEKVRLLANDKKVLKPTTENAASREK